jgi:hypothetical protein
MKVGIPINHTRGGDERQFVPGVDLINNETSYFQAFEVLEKSIEYTKFQKELSDSAFLMKYVYPEKLALAMEATMRAHDYMFNVRGLRQITSNVDIVMRDP